MPNVTRLRHALPLSADINKALSDIHCAIATTVNGGEPPQGYLSQRGAWQR